MYGLKIAGTDQVLFGPIPILINGSQNYLEHCQTVRVSMLGSVSGCKLSIYRVYFVNHMAILLHPIFHVLSCFPVMMDQCAFILQMICLW